MSKLKKQGFNDIEIYHSNGMLGFEHEGFFIIEPRMSTCGRFEVDPYEEYGLNDKQVAMIEKFNTVHDLSDKPIDFTLGFTEQEQIEIERKLEREEQIKRDGSGEWILS